MNQLRRQLKKLAFIQLFSSVKITVACLFLLFILIFWGTVAQVENGLFNAQERYFNSYIFLVFGFLPFPGAQTVLWILFINLSSVAITHMVYRWSHVGIVVIHIGLLTYFIAAFVTLHNTQESHLTLLENAGSNVSSSYHDWELAVWSSNTLTNTLKKEIIAFDTKYLMENEFLEFPEHDLSLIVKAYYANAQAFTIAQQPVKNLHNDSGIESIKRISPNIEPEKNFPGGIFEIKDKTSRSDQLLLYGAENNPTRISVNGNTLYVQLRRKRLPLPFILTLKDFRMEKHPNTEIARTYQSLVTLNSQDTSREVLISMNEPLRFQDYTLYQASYSIDTLGRELSTLAVVKNSNRLLPYVASFLTFAGLVTHFLCMAFNKRFSRARVKLT